MTETVGCCDAPWGTPAAGENSQIEALWSNLVIMFVRAQDSAVKDEHGFPSGSSGPLGSPQHQGMKADSSSAIASCSWYLEAS